MPPIHVLYFHIGKTLYMNRGYKYMQIHFSEALNFSDSKKDLLSTLIAKRVILLIGERKANKINNIYFSDTVSHAQKKTSTASISSDEVITNWSGGEMDIYCDSYVLNKLLHQGSGHLLFDHAIIAISNSIPLN